MSVGSPVLVLDWFETIYRTFSAVVRMCDLITSHHISASSLTVTWNLIYMAQKSTVVLFGQQASSDALSDSLSEELANKSPISFHVFAYEAAPPVTSMRCHL